MLRSIPDFFYGTAWKEGDTETFTYQAIKAGMRAIDTANQRKHYYEEGAGSGIQRSIDEGLATREDLYLQTKFTHCGGQDHRLPYDPTAAIAEQVFSSCQSSLGHLKTSYLDSILIHGPMRREGLTESDWSAWQALERLVEIGWVRSIGVSNFSESQLRTLFSEAKVKPTFVQNRCYPSIRWDLPVRNLCKSLGIIYQGFNLLRDPILAQSVVIANLCARYEMPLGQLIYSFALQSHILPITGARNLGRLQENLSAKKDVLAPEDLAAIEKVAVG